MGWLRKDEVKKKKKKVIKPKKEIKEEDEVEGEEEEEEEDEVEGEEEEEEEDEVEGEEEEIEPIKKKTKSPEDSTEKPENQPTIKDVLVNHESRLTNIESALFRLRSI